jgi:hypothetical protein
LSAPLGILLASAFLILGFALARMLQLKVRPEARQEISPEVARRRKKQTLFAVGVGLVGSVAILGDFADETDRSFLAWLVVVTVPFGVFLLGFWVLTLWARRGLGEDWNEIVTNRRSPVTPAQRTIRAQFVVGGVLLVALFSLLFGYMLRHVVF